MPLLRGREEVEIPGRDLDTDEHSSEHDCNRVICAYALYRTILGKLRVSATKPSLERDKLALYLRRIANDARSRKISLSLFCEENI